jgi:hypothetical protein
MQTCKAKCSVSRDINLGESGSSRVTAAFLPALARHGRQGLGRSRLQARASQAASVRRQSRRKPARAGPLVGHPGLCRVVILRSVQACATAASHASGTKSPAASIRPVYTAKRNAASSPVTYVTGLLLRESVALVGCQVTTSLMAKPPIRQAGLMGRGQSFPQAAFAPLRAHPIHRCQSLSHSRAAPCSRSLNLRCRGCPQSARLPAYITWFPSANLRTTGDVAVVRADEKNFVRL